MKNNNRGYLVSLILMIIIFIFSGHAFSPFISMRLNWENIKLLRAVFQNPGDIDNLNYQWLESLKPVVSQNMTCHVANTQAMIAFFQKKYENVLTLANNLDDGPCMNNRLIVGWEAQSYYEVGSYSMAVSAWKGVRAIVPLQHAGDQFAKQGQWDAALLAYSAVVDLVPDDCIYRTRLGNAFWLGKLEDERALEQYMLVMKKCPDNLESFIMASRVLIDQGNFGTAESLAAQAHAKFPSSELPLNTLALSKLRQNSPSQARVLIEESLLLNPESAETHALLGSAYFALSMPEDAIREFQIAIAIGPQGWYYESLGLIYERIGDSSSAITAYIKALEFFPERDDLRIKILELQRPK